MDNNSEKDECQSNHEEEDRIDEENNVVVY